MSSSIVFKILPISALLIMCILNHTIAQTNENYGKNQMFIVHLKINF